MKATHTRRVTPHVVLKDERQTRHVDDYIRGHNAIVGVAIILALALLATISGPVQPAHASSQSTAHTHHDDIRTIFDGTNTIRKDEGKDALKYDARITIVAYDWSKSMGNNGKMAHNPKYSSQIPSGWTRAGENVAFACGYGKDSAKQIVANWKKSPGHFANMTGDFTSIGIGVYWIKGCMYATQNFGKYTNPVAYSLPSKTGEVTSVANQVDHTKSYTSQINSANSAQKSAKASQSSASKALASAKKSRNQAKSYANSKRATKKTKANYKKAVTAYNKTNTYYKKVKASAASAKKALANVKKYAKAGKASKVKSELKKAQTAQKNAKAQLKTVKKYQKQVASYTKAAKKSRK